MLQLVSGHSVMSVPTEQVIQAWPLVRPHIDRALEQNLGEYDLPDVLKALMDGKAQLWLATDVDKLIQGIAVTEITEYPRRKICNLWLVAGVDLSQWESGLAYIEEWAVARGCSGLQATCRPGMARYAKKLGFSVERQQVFKPLLKNLD